MSSTAEIQAAIDALPVEEVHQLALHAQARLNALKARRFFYDEMYGKIGDYELIVEADAAFLMYDLREDPPK